LVIYQIKLELQELVRPPEHQLAPHLMKKMIDHLDDFEALFDPKLLRLLLLFLVGHL